MFTPAEQVEVRRLVEAGVSLRTAIRYVEAAMTAAAPPASRTALAALLHPLLEADEGAAACLFLLAGGIVARGEDEKVALRLEPRAEFIARGLRGLDAAIVEATEALDGLRALLAVETPPDANLTLALVHTSRALARLRAFNRALAYADPLAWPGVDTVIQRDSMTHLWRFSGQYLYDGLSGVLDAYVADPTGFSPAQLAVMKDALGYGWLCEDDAQKTCARFLGLAWVAGETPLVAAYSSLLNVTSPRFQFCVTYVAQLLGASAVLNRPESQRLLIVAVAKLVDAWKRLDYAASLVPTLAGWATLPVLAAVVADDVAVLSDADLSDVVSLFLAA